MKKCLEICVSVFEMLKRLLKMSYQTGLTFLHIILGNICCINGYFFGFVKILLTSTLKIYNNIFPPSHFVCPV